MSNALSLRRVPLMTIRAHPIRSLIIAVLALAQAACLFGGFILVGAMRAELTLAERRLGADLVVYPTACLNQVEKKRLLMLGTPVGCHQPRSALARMSSNEDIAAVSYQLYVSEDPRDDTRRRPDATCAARRERCVGRGKEQAPSQTTAQSDDPRMTGS